MGWLNFEIFTKADGSKSLVSEINGKIENVSTWRIKDEVEKALVEHFTGVMINKLGDQIVDQIKPEVIMDDVREAFRNRVKEQLGGTEKYIVPR